ncbi:probable cysteine--tRNA ligase, mitochondrial isoform X2 [Chelonus insularis]|nr:probable cysteine--tRNA ligase, mitochondrial isoform X2 [Chelonus insularis]
MEFFDINVIAVMGITDIDDKIIRRSQGSTQFSDWKQLAKFYEQQFYEHISSLNIMPPYLYCKVSDYIPQIIQFIDKIMSNNSAYLASDGSVYFDTQKYGKYGKFSRSEAEERHAIKKSSLDFALWKASKKGEPSWDSPWGPGRPGWHIECSTMGSFTLGDNIDIHSGGFDLIFPHHENEEAQSCCYHQTDQWVNYWIHSGLLHLEDVKMSKSLQNTISIPELLEKYTANEFRLMCLTTNYRNDIDFCHEIMQKSVTLMNKINHFYSNCKNYATGKLPVGVIDENIIYEELNKAKERIYSALCDDFATPKVIAQLSDLIDAVNKTVNDSQSSGKKLFANNIVCINAVAIYVSKILSALGITKLTQKAGNEQKFSGLVDDFVAFRGTVRQIALSGREITKGELLKACDDSRKSLAANGIQLKDHKNTSTWTLVEE